MRIFAHFPAVLAITSRVFTWNTWPREDPVRRQGGNISDRSSVMISGLYTRRTSEYVHIPLSSAKLPSHYASFRFPSAKNNAQQTSTHKNPIFPFMPRFFSHISERISRCSTTPPTPFSLCVKSSPWSVINTSQRKCQTSDPTPNKLECDSELRI